MGFVPLLYSYSEILLNDLPQKINMHSLIQFVLYKSMMTFVSWDYREVLRQTVALKCLTLQG